MRWGTQYRHEVDGLRAVAVLAVIAHHFSAALLPGGYLGVDVFFVISGYVITASLAGQRELSARDFLAGFYARRIKRLLPALLVCVVVTGVVGSLFIDGAIRDYQTIIMSGAWALFGASNIYFFGKATDYFASSTELNLFTHTWSLGVEEQFYLVYPAMFLLFAAAVRRGAGHRFIAGFGLLIALSLASFLVLLKIAPSAAYFLMPMRFWELGAGCLTYALLSRPWTAGLQREAVGVGAAAGLLASFAMPLSWQAEATVLAVTCTAGLIAALRPGMATTAALSLRPVVWLGLISYSLYLWHWSVLSLARWTVGVDLVTAPFLVALMLALAALSYHFIERPLRYRTWSLWSGRTIGYGLAASTLAFACMLALRFPLRGDLYTGAPAPIAELGAGKLLNERDAAGAILWRAHDCTLTSNGDVGKDMRIETCLLGGERAPGERLFLVVGNSFSAAERDLVHGLREEKLGAVALTSSWGASPVGGVPNATPWSKANDHYWTSVVPGLLRELHAGDFLIMISDVADLTPANPGAAAVERIHLLSQNLSRLAEELGPRGVGVIFQHGNPYMREARCTPTMAKQQWFHREGVGVCNYLTKAETLRRRSPLSDALEEIERRQANFRVLDLMPVFCPGAVCEMQANGIFMYGDQHSHPSASACRLARPLLIDLVNQMTIEVASPW